MVTLALAVLAACTRRDTASSETPDAAPTREVSAAVASAPPELPARAERMTDEGMLAEAARFVDDPSFRRRALEASLVNPQNTYSRHRLEHYGKRTSGWDLLPEWNPESVPVTKAVVEDLRAQRPLAIGAPTRPLWNGARPTTMAEWVALGREVFFGYPLRTDIYVRWALEHPPYAERMNLRPARDGTYPGVRAFVNVDGRPEIGITCAVCHTNVGRDGDVVVGEARRAFDYGALRLAYHADTKTPIEPELARRMKSWGPGRADVTEDDDEDPVAIPDLWGLRHQTFLTQAGTIRHDGPSALAIRQETQLLHSNHQTIRPPRVLVYALALFLYSLEAPSRGAADAPPRGRELFAQHCARCHANPAYGGPSVPAAVVGTNDALANGGARGTGKYRPPALLRVAHAAPYFHDGSVPTLEDVLSPARLAPSYAKSPLGRGAVPGHAFGTGLPPADRATLVVFLRSL